MKRSDLSTHNSTSSISKTRPLLSTLTMTNPHVPSIPDSFVAWEYRATQLGLLTTTMSDLSPLHSASKFTEAEFITLRAIWPEKSSISSFKFPKSDGQLISKAKGVLKEFPEFQKYLDHVINNRDISRELGPFQFVRDSQSQIPSDPSNMVDSEAVVVRRRSPRNQGPFPLSLPMVRDDSHSTASTGPTDVTAAADADPPLNMRTSDEQIVNDALLHLLKALTMNVPGVSCRWSSARAPFERVRFGDNSFVARIDGYLQGLGVPDIFAIVEVKPQIRDRTNRPALYWQETAEMVAWIMHDAKVGNMTCDR